MNITKIALPITITCSLMHIVCCAIPLLLNALNLITIFNISSYKILNFEWFEEIEIKLLLISGALLLTSILVQFYSKYIKCCSSKDVVKYLCNPRRKIGDYLLVISTTLYLVNLSTLIIERFI